MIDGDSRKVEERSTEGDFVCVCVVAVKPESNCYILLSITFCNHSSCLIRFAFRDLNSLSNMIHNRPLDVEINRPRPLKDKKRNIAPKLFDLPSKCVATFARRNLPPTRTLHANMLSPAKVA